MNHFQAIVTKFHGPTNFRGSRVSARAMAGRKFYSWDHALNTEENHEQAAQAFAESLGWINDPKSPRTQNIKLVGGGMPDGKGNVYIMLEDTYPQLG